MPTMLARTKLLNPSRRAQPADLGDRRRQHRRHRERLEGGEGDGQEQTEGERSMARVPDLGR
jgi:hypothetical protein